MQQSHRKPAELLAEMTPAVQAFVMQHMARLNSNEVRLETSERGVAGLEKENRTPLQRQSTISRNSAMPPSSDRPEQIPPKGEKMSTGKEHCRQAAHFGPDPAAIANILTVLGRIVHRIMADLLRSLFFPRISANRIFHLQRTGGTSQRAGYEGSRLTSANSLQ
jgi:hypothetical protein